MHEVQYSACVFMKLHYNFGLFRHSIRPSCGGWRPVGRQPRRLKNVPASVPTLAVLTMLQDSSPRPITILHASMTGRAQFLALQLADELDARGIDCTVLDMNDADVKTLSAGGLFLICTSTFGQGEVPDNAQFLFQELEAARPDLAAVDYGVLALGDRSYLTTFCYGGKRFDALLRGLGARRIGALPGATGGRQRQHLGLPAA